MRDSYSRRSLNDHEKRSLFYQKSKPSSSVLLESKGEWLSHLYYMAQSHSSLFKPIRMAHAIFHSVMDEKRMKLMLKITEDVRNCWIELTSSIAIAGTFYLKILIYRSALYHNLASFARITKYYPTPNSSKSLLGPIPLVPHITHLYYSPLLYPRTLFCDSFPILSALLFYCNSFIQNYIFFIGEPI